MTSHRPAERPPLRVVRPLRGLAWSRPPLWLLIAAVLAAGVFLGMGLRQPDVDACRLAAANYRDYTVFRLADLADRVPADRAREAEVLARAHLRYERCNREAWLP